MKYSLLIKAKTGALLGNKSSYYFFKCKIDKYRDDLSCRSLALNISVFLECKTTDKGNTQDSYFFGTLKKLPGWKLVAEGM